MSAAAELFIHVVGKVDPSLPQSVGTTEKSTDDLAKAMVLLTREVQQLNGELPKLGQKLRDQGGASEEAAKKLEKARDSMEKVGGAATTVSVAAGAVAAAMLLIGQQAVSAAAQMEVYRAKLETVQHSSILAQQTLSSAVSFAAKTPFDVDGIVNASVQLEVYGARSQQVLPMVADLAAGMGTSIQDTALTIGKAWSGSLEGFESLRNTYGLSISQLKAFGGAVDQQGQVLTKTTGQINQNRQALAAWVAANFGGAIERQLNTFSGKLSNFGDAIKTAFVGIGEALLPLAKTLVEWGSSIVGLFNDLSPGTKSVIVDIGLVITGVTGLVAVLAGGVAAFLAAGAAAAVVTAALPLLGGAMTAAAGAITGLAGSLAGLALGALLTPIGLAVTAFATLGTAIYSTYKSFSDWNKAELESQRLLKEEDNLVRKARSEWDGYTEAIRAAAASKGGFTDSSNQNVALGNLGTAIDNASPADAAKELQKRGFDAERLKGVQAGASNQAKMWGTRLQSLESENSKYSMNESESVAIPLEQDSEASKAFGGKTSVTLGELRAKIASTRQEFGEFVKTANGAGQLLAKVWDPMTQTLSDTQNRLSALQDYFDFSGASDSVEGLTGKVSELDKVYADLLNNLPKGLPTDQAGMLAYIKDKTNPEVAREQVKLLLKVQQDRNAAAKDLNAKDKEERQKRIDDIKANLEDEVSAGRAGIKERIAAQQQILDIAKGNKELERQAQRDMNALQKEQRDGELQSFEDQISDRRAFLDRLKGQNQLTLEEERRAKMRMLAELQAYRTNNQATLSRPENKNQARQLRNQQLDMEAEIGSINRQIQDRNLTQMQDREAKFNAAREQGAARSTTLQIKDIEMLSDMWRTAMQTRQITAEAGEAKMRELATRRANLEKQAIDEQRSAEMEINSARQELLAGNLEDLRTQLSTGKQVQSEIVDNLRQQLALKIRNINLAAQKELEVEGLTQAQITAIHAKAGLQRLEALRAQKKALQDILGSQDAGLKAIQDKVSKIKDLANKKTAEQPDENAPKAAPKFGDGFAEQQNERAAQDIQRIISGPISDRSSMDQLKSALDQFGIVLTSQAELAGQSAGSGKTYGTLESVQKEFGVAPQSDQSAIRSAITELDTQITSLESALKDGLGGEISNLSTSVDKLATALGGTAKAPEQPGVPAQGAVATPGGPAAGVPGAPPAPTTEATTSAPTLEQIMSARSLSPQAAAIASFTSNRGNYRGFNADGTIQMPSASGFTAPALRAPKASGSPAGATASATPSAGGAPAGQSVSTSQTVINIGDLGIPPVDSVKQAAVALARAVQQQVSGGPYG